MATKKTSRVTPKQNNNQGPVQMQQPAPELVPIPHHVDVAVHSPEDGSEKLVLLRIHNVLQTQHGLAQLPPNIVPLLANEAKELAKNLVNSADEAAGKVKKASGLIVPGK